MTAFQGLHVLRREWAQRVYEFESFQKRKIKGSTNVEINLDLFTFDFPCINLRAHFLDNSIDFLLTEFT